MLKGNYYGKSHNSTSILLSYIITTNAKCLYLYRPLSLQSADIPSVNIPFVDILSTSWTKTSKEKKVDIIKDLL